MHCTHKHTSLSIVSFFPCVAYNQDNDQLLIGSTSNSTFYIIMLYSYTVRSVAQRIAILRPDRLSLLPSFLLLLLIILILILMIVYSSR